MCAVCTDGKIEHIIHHGISHTFADASWIPVPVISLSGPRSTGISSSTFWRKILLPLAPPNIVSRCSKWLKHVEILWPQEHLSILWGWLQAQWDAAKGGQNAGAAQSAGSCCPTSETAPNARHRISQSQGESSHVSCHCIRISQNHPVILAESVKVRIKTLMSDGTPALPWDTFRNSGFQNWIFGSM